jgi:hypothetical protein
MLSRVHMPANLSSGITHIPTEIPDLLECTSSGTAAGPNGSESSTSTGGPLSGVTIGRRALLQ